MHRLVLVPVVAALLCMSLAGSGSALPGQRRVSGRLSWEFVYPTASGLFTVDSIVSKPRRLTTGSDESAPRWSPNGQSVSFVRLSKRGVYSLYAVAAATGSPRELLRLGGQGAPVVAWAPDSRRLALLDGNALTVIDTRSGKVTKILRLPTSPTGPIELALSWSPTGTRLACDCGPGLYTLGVDGSSPHLLIASSQEALGGIAWAPDGQSIAYKRHCTATSSDSYCDLAVMDEHGEHRRTLVAYRGNGRGTLPDSPVWLPRSNVIASIFNYHRVVLANAGTDNQQFLSVPAGDQLSVGASSDTLALSCHFSCPSRALTLIKTHPMTERRIQLPANTGDGDVWVR
jgi:dipeptidyl aminopeptidase/acylaminoacyl peptidase